MTRITSAMMTNTTLMHINRNMRNLDEIIRQIETTQRMQRPSDDPIRASRALKFRTNQVENEQFQQNVLTGMARMNVTEAALTNVNSELIARIRELVVAADGGETVEQKQGMIAQIQSLFQAIGNEMNQSFAGSYLFSGFRTDEPPVFNRDNNRDFVITQNFNISDITRSTSFQRIQDLDGIMQPEIRNIHVINLAFSGLSTSGTPDATTHIVNPAGISIPGFTVHKFSKLNPDAYIPPAGTTPPILHLIAETGELVMHPDVAASFPREGISVTYRKQGFNQGDINPAVYFTAREIKTDPPGFTPISPANVEKVYRVTQYMSRASGTPVGAPPTAFQFTLTPAAAFAGQNAAGNFNDVATNLRPALPPGIPDSAFDPATGILTIPASFFDLNDNVSVTYSVMVPPGGAPAINDIMSNLNIHGVELVRAVARNPIAADPNGSYPAFSVGTSIPLHLLTSHRTFDMNDQEMQFEFSPHTHVTVNSLAKNVLTDKMFADFRRFFEMSDAIHINERATLEQIFTNQGLTGDALENAVVDQLVKETAIAESALQTVLNNMLFLIDRHADNSGREQTLLGSRMVRMDLLQSRLEQDAVTFEILTRDNEATDIPRALILKASAEATFMASLRANSGVVQMSLAQFIN